jgi:hypothetical protein
MTLGCRGLRASHLRARADQRNEPQGSLTRQTNTVRPRPENSTASAAGGLLHGLTAFHEDEIRQMQNLASRPICAKTHYGREVGIAPGTADTSADPLCDWRLSE